MKKIDLSGTWDLLQGGDGPEGGQAAASARQAVPMPVPGDNLSALLEAGIVPDPYFAMNELDVQWVGRSDWLITRSFTVSEDFLAHRHAFLSLGSVDTFATVLINGNPVARTSNMFVPLDAEIDGVLQKGENRIEVRFHSAVACAGERGRNLPYPVPYTTYPIQSPHRNLIRKVQCHAGWDWGPCLMVSGIYGGAFIGSCARGRILNVSTDQAFNGPTSSPGSELTGAPGACQLSVSVDYLCYEAGEIQLEIEAAGVRRTVTLTVVPGVIRHTEALGIEQPALWWPAGYGQQNLCSLTVRVGEETVSKRIGFRRLEVITRDDQWGRSMTFRVNGVDVFCKGANWIPVDALPSRQTPERYERLINAAVSANMNMLRVWGGGQYERDIFYDLCDAKGILVWQDFMFSCAAYPAAPAFLAEVEPEIRCQVKRLKDHPCLALWCGNNEDLGALGWFPETRANPARYLVDYDRLNEGVVGRVARELDPGRTWWPSSPCAGAGDYSDNWHSDNKGDMHFWSVWHEGKSFEAYREVTPRFCSEFGFQSLPSLETARGFLPPTELNVTSPVMEHHQRHPRGNAVILETMSRYFRIPETFEAMLYVSQVQQAMAITMAVEYWRSRRPVCMGALYWQLNDCWPVASWSSVESSGRWRLLHYAARRFFAPVHVVAFPEGPADGKGGTPAGAAPPAGATSTGAAPSMGATPAGAGTFAIAGINDEAEEVRGNLALRLIDFKGNVLYERSTAASLSPRASTRLASLSLEEAGVQAEQAFLVVELQAKGAAYVNSTFLCPPKRCPIEEPGLAWKTRTEADGEIGIELSVKRPAFFVSLELHGLGGTFSDNCFTLLPGAARIVRFSPEAGVDPAGFIDRMTIWHLRKTYR